MRPTTEELRIGEAAAWGSPPATDGVRLLSFKAMRKNSLRGFADVNVPAWHLTLLDCAVLVSNGRAWVNLPSRPVIDRDGRYQKNTATGKLEYMPVAKWDGRTVGDRFSNAVIKLIRARHPGALDD